jgi:GxxExxY protein
VGLLETVYEVILAHELRQRGLCVEQQVPILIEFRGIKFHEAFRADIVGEGKVVLELKSVEQITRAHKKQLQTYLRLTGYKLGFLLNFGESRERLTGLTMTDLFARLAHLRVRKRRQEKEFKLCGLSVLAR